MIDSASSIQMSKTVPAGSSSRPSTVMPTGFGPSGATEWAIALRSGIRIGWPVIPRSTMSARAA